MQYNALHFTDLNQAGLNFFILEKELIMIYFKYVGRYGLDVSGLRQGPAMW